MSLSGFHWVKWAPDEGSVSTLGLRSERGREWGSGSTAVGWSGLFCSEGWGLFQFVFEEAGPGPEKGGMCSRLSAALIVDRKKHKPSLKVEAGPKGNKVKWNQKVWRSDSIALDSKRFKGHVLCFYKSSKKSQAVAETSNRPEHLWSLWRLSHSVIQLIIPSKVLHPPGPRWNGLCTQHCGTEIGHC